MPALFSQRWLLAAALLGLVHECTAQSVLFVDSRISTASCTTYSPALGACGSGTNVAYRTIAGAAAVAAPGTTVLIRGGTYNEQLNPPKSGTAGYYITFKNYGSEAVYLTGSPGINLLNRNYLIIDGLHVEDTTWLEATNSHYNILQNCVFKRTPVTGTTGNVRFVKSNYNLVLNNDIEDGNDNLLFIGSDSNLAEGNTILEARHSIFGIRCGNYNVLRNNYFANSKQKIGEVYDCGVDTHAVPNVFDATKHNVIEGNTFALASTYYSTSGGNGIQYAGQQGVIRGNIFYSCNVGVAMQYYGDEALYDVSNRVYHNVFYANTGPGIAVYSTDTNNIYRNNILLGNQGCLPTCTNVSPGQVVYRGLLAGAALFDHNDLVYHAAGQPVIEEEFGSGYTIAQYTSRYPGIFVNSYEADPQFVNPTNYDFHLQSTSPMIDAGAFLTRTASAGSGTVMAVADAVNFCDGYGIPGEPGDPIQLQGQTQTARVIHVDYTSNLLTLDQSLAWTNSQGVSLQYSGRAPDLGAFEFSQPNLSIQWTPNEVVLSWPLSSGAYRLESTTNLNATIWSPQTNAVAAGNQWVVTNKITGSRQFFRLKK